ncbi:hypothetical protein Landi51_12566 [Colletotrichum acutatum]
MATPTNFKRIVVCVDGTWYNEDGQEGRGSGNNSNIFRIYASVKVDEPVTDEFGNTITQIVRYFPGIGVDKKPLDKWNDGMTGKGCTTQIKEVFTVLAGDTFGEDVGTDVSFAHHVRHALALNEARRAFPLLPIEASEGTTSDGNQTSHLQAWFVGAHADMGGGAEHDGLSLYPLQWMLVESRDRGLVLEHNPADRRKNLIDDPLELVFPKSSPLVSAQKAGIPAGDADSIKPEPWTFRYSSNIDISMYDLRDSHMHGNLQKIPPKKLQRPNVRRSNSATHWVAVNTGLLGTFGLGPRQIFRHNSSSTSLQGYQDASPNGTVIHPSAYFLSDTYPTLGIQEALESLKKPLDDFRKTSNMTYISDNGDAKIDPWIRDFLSNKVTTCRILVCGNTGVGKSTLLNRVFGITMTQEEESQKGRHNIEEGFESDQHPGIIIHDSEGFQAGDTREISAFKKFLKTRADKADVSQKLHAIWLCIDTDSDRPVQTALVNVLKQVTKYMPATPIIVVGTRKDRFLDRHRDGIEKDLILNKQEVFKTSFEDDVETSPLWPMLNTKFTFVSRDDQESIKSLIHETVGFFSDASVSEAMIAAQVPDINAKIDLAIEKTLKFLKAAVGAVSSGFGTGVVSAVSTPTISRVLCRDIAHGCFGLPETGIAQMDTILASVVWKNLAPFMAQAVGQ